MNISEMREKLESMGFKCSADECGSFYIHSTETSGYKDTALVSKGIRQEIYFNSYEIETEEELVRCAVRFMEDSLSRLNDLASELISERDRISDMIEVINEYEPY